MPSPPPVYNFARIRIVRSRESWWAIKHPERMHLDPIEVTPLAGAPAHATEQAHEAVAIAAPDEAPAVIHMPSPSYWPPVAACGLLVLVCSLLTTMALVPIGVLLVSASIYGWSTEAP
jgi:hypothetical protein